MAINNDQVVCKLKDINHGEVSLSAMEWAFITQIDGKRSIAEVAKSLNMTSEEAIKFGNMLVEKGLIEVETATEKEKYISENFFHHLEKSLVQYIGPVATYVVNDAIMEMNLERSKFPRSLIPELIELLSEEITDESKKVQFQKEMLELMRGL